MTKRSGIRTLLRASLGRYLILFGPGLSCFLAAAALRHLHRAEEWMGQILLTGLVTLLCFLTIWSTLSSDRILVRMSRGLCQIASVYFFILLGDAISGERLEKPVPAATASAMLSFVVATFLAAGLMRLCRFRLTNARPSPGSSQYLPLQPGQFGLIKLFQLTTASAIFLGLGVATIPKFRDEPAGCLPGFGHAVLVIVSLVLCGPVGVVAVLLAWIVMGAGFARTRFVIGAVLGIAWLLCAPFAFRSPMENAGALAFWLLLLLSLWMLAFGGTARALGWQIVRVPRAAATPGRPLQSDA